MTYNVVSGTLNPTESIKAYFQHRIQLHASHSSEQFATLTILTSLTLMTGYSLLQNIHNDCERFRASAKNDN